MKTSVELDKSKLTLARRLTSEPTIKGLLDKALDALIMKARREGLANMLDSNFFEGSLDVMRERKPGEKKSASRR